MPLSPSIDPRRMPNASRLETV